MAEGRAKRERKVVEHFSPGDTLREAQKTVVQEGKGTKLADIPNVCFKLDKLKGADELLEGLHAVLFKSKGKAHSRKRDVKSFSGFVYATGSEDTEQQKVVAKLNKWTTNSLNSLLDLLDLPRGTGEEGTKDKKIDKLVHFLKEPKASTGKNLAEQASRKKEKAAQAKAKKEAAVGKEIKKDNTKKAKVANGGSAKKEAKAPEKRATGKRKASDAEQKPAKKAKHGKKAEETSGKKKASVKWPTDGKVKEDVESILQASLSAKGVTMKDVYAELGKKYNISVDEVKEKKDLIKEVVTTFQAKNGVVGPDDAETDAPVTAEEPVAEIPAAEEGTAAEPEAEKMDTDGAAETKEIKDKPETVDDESKPMETDAEAALEVEDEPLITETAPGNVSQAAGQVEGINPDTQGTDTTQPTETQAKDTVVPEKTPEEPTPTVAVAQEDAVFGDVDEFKL